MQDPQHIVVPPMTARAAVVRRGQLLRVLDPSGGQPGDLVAYCLNDLSERFSQARTRVENRTCRISPGHRLWTNALEPRVMFSVTENTAGQHDLLYTPCCRYALEKRFGVSRDGCWENLAGALAPWGLGPRDVPDPLNLFFGVSVSPEGDLAIRDQGSRPGDAIELLAEMDCLVAVAACSVPNPGRANTGFAIEIHG